MWQNYFPCRFVFLNAKKRTELQVSSTSAFFAFSSFRRIFLTPFVVSLSNHERCAKSKALKFLDECAVHGSTSSPRTEKQTNSQQTEKQTSSPRTGCKYKVSSFPRAAWERISDALRPKTFAQLFNQCALNFGAARQVYVPTQRVGTRTFFHAAFVAQHLQRFLHDRL